jgi:hypothetical protein
VGHAAIYPVKFERGEVTQRLRSRTLEDVHVGHESRTLQFVVHPAGPSFERFSHQPVDTAAKGSLSLRALHRKWHVFESVIKSGNGSRSV